MPSKKTKLDHALAIFRAGVSTVPYIGGAIASLIGDYIPSATLRSIETTIQILNKKLNIILDRINLDLVNKDQFSELFKICLFTIIQTQQKEKLNAAANILTNILLKEGDPEKITYTELEHFARCLETLSIGAIKVLGHSVEIARKSKPKEYKVRPVRLSFDEFQQRMPNTDIFLLMGLLGELNSMNLIHLRSPRTASSRYEIATFTHYSNYSIESTPLGVRFCERLLEK